jgi:DNA polymerase-1
MIELLYESDHGFGFDVIKYTEDKKTKQQTDTPSTAEDVLIELQERDDSGFLTNLLELRGLTKLNSTYIVGMWEKMNSNDKIHGSFLLHGTVTGRLSSRNPNLQNIPRDTTSSDIKKMFITPPGKLMLQLDYSQAELRVLAAAAKESTMIHWFKIGRDVHLASACLKWDFDYDEAYIYWKNEDHEKHKEWKAKRKQAKTINFGIVYGQTARKLSTSLSTDDHRVSLDEAQEFLDNFNEQFPAIDQHIKNQQRFAKKNGFVYNLFGRKRRLPNVDSDNWGKKAEALRQAVNAPIQGAASDFTLFSSILIREHVNRSLLPKSLEQVGTVHDSLIFYIDPQDIHQAIPKLYQICKNPETKTWFNFEVQGIEMKVDFEIGINWFELKGYDPQEDYTKWIA